MPLRPAFIVPLLVLTLADARAQDAAAGGMAFQQCADCHSTGNSDAAGPGLKGVFGRRAGSKPGFEYSPAMQSSKVVWDERSLSAYLADPRAVVPGTTMAYAGNPDEHERADLVAFLRTLK